MNRKQHRAAAKSAQKQAPSTARDPGEALAEAQGFHERGEFQRAADLYHELLKDDPRRSDVLHMIGRDAAAQGQAAVGGALLEEAATIGDSSADLLVDLALALETSNRIEDAITAYRRAVVADPEHRVAWLNMGILARRLGHFEDAVVAAERALALDGDDPIALGLLGGALVQLDRAAEAEPAFRRAAELQPADGPAFNNLALALRAQGRLDDAVAAGRTAIEHGPDDAEAHVHLAELLLLDRKFEDGFREYEWRRRLPDVVIGADDLGSPSWDGGDTAGRTILVVAEQGFGDTLQFCRYASILAARGARVVLVVQEALADLCRTLDGVDTIVASGSPLPAVDVVVPLLSLPHLLGVVPVTAPYLSPPMDRDERFRDAVAGGVGISWQGNPDGPGDRGRSVPLARFHDLADIDGVHLISLQKGFGHEQLADLPPGIAIEDAGSRCNDFADTAAVMATLDLVITTDTAVAHLAGALGRPVWVMLKYDPDWRWHRESEESSWYPSLRLFRQKTAGDWDSVFEDVRAALVERQRTDM